MAAVAHVRELSGFDDIIMIRSFTLTLIATFKLVTVVTCAVVAATLVDADMLTQRYASTAFILLCNKHKQMIKSKR